LLHCLPTLFDPDDKQESQENTLVQRHPSHFLHNLTTSVIINKVYQTCNDIS
jgi:hypothetical protein